MIPTLCRADKFKRLVESLARNEEYAKETELVIGLDFPPAEKYRKGWQEIKDYLPTITGFGKVTIFEQDHNVGGAGNGRVLRNYIFNKKGYDSYIYFEDDNEVSPNFLEFMNKGLEKYKNDKNVYSISGYNYPIDMTGYDKNVYASWHFSAWGVGRWHKKIFKLTNEELKAIIFKPTNYLRLLFNHPEMLSGLYRMFKKGQIHGDRCYELYSYLNGWVSIFPTVSKVRNWGHDGTGEHCGNCGDKFTSQPIDKDTSFTYDEIPLKSQFLPSLNRYFGVRFTTRIHQILDAFALLFYRGKL